MSRTSTLIASLVLVSSSVVSAQTNSAMERIARGLPLRGSARR